jgi:general secretion pathway protein A
VGFGPEAAVAVADLADGLPRRINVVCDRALEEGRLEGVNVITADLVKRAARSVGMPESSPAAPDRRGDSPGPSLVLGQLAERPTARPWIPIAFAGALAALVFAGYSYYAESALAEVAVIAVPARPVERATLPSSARPLPPDDEFLRLLVPPRRTAPPAIPPSGELPDNPNQFN